MPIRPLRINGDAYSLLPLEAKIEVDKYLNTKSLKIKKKNKFNSLDRLRMFFNAANKTRKYGDKVYDKRLRRLGHYGRQSMTGKTSGMKGKRVGRLGRRGRNPLGNRTLKIEHLIKLMFMNDLNVNIKNNLPKIEDAYNKFGVLKKEVGKLEAVNLPVFKKDDDDKPVEMSIFKKDNNPAISPVLPRKELIKDDDASIIINDNPVALSEIPIEEQSTYNTTRVSPNLSLISRKPALHARVKKIGNISSEKAPAISSEKAPAISSEKAPAILSPLEKLNNEIDDLTNAYYKSGDIIQRSALKDQIADKKKLIAAINGGKGENSKYSDKAIYASEIDEIMRQSSSSYIKTITLDEIDEIIDYLQDENDEQTFSFIFNIYPMEMFEENSDIVGHFIAVYCDLNEMTIEIYDPLAEEINEPVYAAIIDPLEEYFNQTLSHMLKLKHNQIRQEPADSYLCAFFCIRFILMRELGLTWKLATGFKSLEDNEEDVELLKNHWDKFGYI